MGLQVTLHSQPRMIGEWSHSRMRPRRLRVDASASRTLLRKVFDGGAPALDRRLTHTTKPEILGFVWLDFRALSGFPVYAG